MNISKSLIITSLFFFCTSLLFPRNAYSQEVTTFAGSGSSGSANGTGTAATFNNPQGAVVDANGNIYIADKFNHSIRKITTSGVVSTFATAITSTVVPSISKSICTALGPAAPIVL